VTRIARIDTFLIRYPDPNDFNFDRQTVVLRAETKDGVTGWGEAIAMWPEACRAVQLLIADGMKPILVGDRSALGADAPPHLVVRRGRAGKPGYFRNRHGALGHSRQV
jgi:L-alanine-DL-glutamate epimerase-like enolase superfamily enzyme